MNYTYNYRGTNKTRRWKNTGGYAKRNFVQPYLYGLNPFQVKYLRKSVLAAYKKAKRSNYGFDLDEISMVIPDQCARKLGGSVHAMEKFNWSYLRWLERRFGKITGV